MKRIWLLSGLLLLALALPALAEDPATPGTPPDNSAPAAQAASTPAMEPMEHVIVMGKEIKWGEPPAGLPKGAKFAVLSGNPAAPGPFTVRAQCPAGFKVMPHFHATAENVTVIAGDFGMGTGDAFDMTKGHQLGVGDFSVMPAGMHHYAWSKKGATIQIHGMGPFSITYINPSDDPRNEKAASK